MARVKKLEKNLILAELIQTWARKHRCIDDAYVSVGGQGKIVQMGFEAEVSGAPLSVQKMDIFIKQGRMY